MDIKEYWQAVLRQDAPAIREYFWEDAYICWHNTDERFTVEEFIRANCEYPGQWDGEVKRLVQDGDQIAVAVRVWTEDGASSFHAVSQVNMVLTAVVVFQNTVNNCTKSKSYVGCTA